MRPETGPGTKLVRPERFELPTPWFEAKYSIQLSYGRIDDYLTIFTGRSSSQINLLGTLLAETSVLLN